LPYLFLSGSDADIVPSVPVFQRLPQRSPVPSNSRTVNVTSQLRWAALTWRPIANSPCVPSYEWTSNAADLDCPLKQSQKECGGIVMSGCSSFVSGEFVPALPLDPKPRKLWASRTPGLPFCSNESHVANGAFLESVETFLDSNVWAPFNCALVPLDLESLARVSVGGPVIYVGDSHARNSYSAFVAGLRQRAYFVETHDAHFKELRGMLVYRVQRIAGKIMDHRGVVLLANQSPSTLHDQLDCNANADLCIQVLFFWAPNFADQSLLFPLIKSLHPRLMVISPGNSYERQAPFADSYSRNLTELAQALPRLTITFNIWPWGNLVSIARVEAICAWRMKVPNKVHVLNHLTFNTYGGVQASRTWHYACSGRHGSSGLLQGVEAFENCSDIVDTSLARAALTLALH